MFSFFSSTLLQKRTLRGAFWTSMLIALTSITIVAQSNEPTTEQAKKYLAFLQRQKLPDDYKQQKEAQKSMRVLANPLGTYQHEVDVNYNYSFWGLISLNAGTTITLETKNSNTDPVLYFFNIDDPATKGSWANDDAVGLESKLTATVQYTGSYVVFLRSYNAEQPGIGQLWKDGALWSSQCSIGGKTFSVPPKAGVVNFFTAKLRSDYNPDTEMYLAETATGPIKAWADDNTAGGSFAWGRASRLRKDFSPDIGFVFIKSRLLNFPTGTCDVYMNCENSDIAPYFPNLNAIDAIKTAPASGNYNCISWSGGITSYWEWPLNTFSSYYNSNPLTAFDNFYRNMPVARYSGAWNYTRSGATAGNSVVDLWALNGTYTHGSVTKPGNDHPHGYDWESKPGGLTRSMHPRDALRGNDYGNIVGYYMDGGTRAARLATDFATSTPERMTLEESIKLGLTKIDEVGFSELEKTKLSLLKEGLSTEVKAEFDRKLEAWKATWQDPKIALHSDPRKYAQSEQYKAFIDFNKKHNKKLWPYLFEKFERSDWLLINAIEDLTLQENHQLLQQVKDEIYQSQYDNDGKYLARNLKGNCMRCGT